MAKIFQLITSVNLGGAENIAFQLSEFSDKENLNKIEFVIVELFPSKNEYATAKKYELQKRNIRVITLISSFKRIALALGPFRLFYFIVKEKPSIIHSHTDLPDFILSCTTRLLKLLKFKIPKIVRSIHNTNLWDTHPRLGKFTEDSISDNAIVAVSENALNAYKKMRFSYNINICDNISIIYNGCKVPKKLSLPFAINNSKINIVFCGRFEYQKGVDILIDRINKINKMHEHAFCFYLIGHGSFKNSSISIHKNNTNVFFYESILNIADKLHNFDFLIMPSRFEGLGLTSIEASFAKVPVIATNALGLNETLPVDWPLKFNLDREDELLKIFDSIVGGNYDLEYLRDKAFNFVNENFSYSKMIDDYFNIYLRLSKSI